MWARMASFLPPLSSLILSTGTTLTTLIIGLSHLHHTTTTTNPRPNAFTFTKTRRSRPATYVPLSFDTTLSCQSANMLMAPLPPYLACPPVPHEETLAITHFRRTYHVQKKHAGVLMESAKGSLGIDAVMRWSLCRRCWP